MDALDLITAGVPCDAGYLSAGTSRAAYDALGTPEFDRHHTAAMADPAVFTFAVNTSDTITVALGLPSYRAGIQHVPYEVTVSATGEIFRGLDFLRDQGTPVRDRDAAIALLTAIGRSEGDAALCLFAECLAAASVVSPTA